MSLRQCYQHIVVKTSQFLLALWQIGVCNKDFFVLFDFFRILAMWYLWEILTHKVLLNANIQYDNFNPAWPTNVQSKSSLHPPRS